MLPINKKNKEAQHVIKRFIINSFCSKQVLYYVVVYASGEICFYFIRFVLVFPNILLENSTQIRRLKNAFNNFQYCEFTTFHIAVSCRISKSLKLNPFKMPISFFQQLSFYMRDLQLSIYHPLLLRFFGDFFMSRPS